MELGGLTYDKLALSMSDWTTAVAPKNPILSVELFPICTSPFNAVAPENVETPVTLKVVPRKMTSSSAVNVPKTVVVAPVCPMLTVPLSALPANAVEDVVPNASSEVLPANAVEDDVPKASTVLAVFAVIALA